MKITKITVLLTLALCLAIFAFSVPTNSFLFAPQRGSQRYYPRNNARVLSSLNMVLTPVGPLCPFRSTATQELDPRFEEFKANHVDSNFAAELSQIFLDLEWGRSPDPDRLMEMADSLNEAHERYESMMTRLRISPDFQTREYAKFIQAHFSYHGVSMESVASMMKWQCECLKAIAKNTPPPMPPSDLDLNSMMSGAKADKPPPSVSAMAEAQPITSSPFQGNEKMFESPQVKEEHEKLCRDHKELIEFGAKYDTFDPLGKLRFLDELEKIEERWEIFFARSSLMGALNKEFEKECNEFLSSMGMKEEDYRKLLKKCHQIMREDAEGDRNRGL